MEFVLSGGKVYRPSGFEYSDIYVKDSLIDFIRPCSDDFCHIKRIEVNDLYIVPGFADVHVHLREPGFSYKETIACGSLAAAKSGYTALCTMPNLIPPPDSAENLAVQLEIIRKDGKVKIYPYGCITKGQKGQGELVDFTQLEPAVAFSDDGKGVQCENLMRQAMEKAAEAGKIIAAHCEDENLLEGGYIHKGEYAQKHGHKGISSQSEYAQLERDLQLAKETGCRYHVCHVSTKESVELIRKAKMQGVKVTAETAPHYLLLCDQDLEEDGRFKMNPPLRGKSDREALIEGIKDGTIDVIATDHAPHSLEEKSKGLKDSLMGISGLETAFPLLYTFLVKKGIITLEKLIEMMAVTPRKIFGLEGGILSGQKADLAVLDLSREWVIDPAEFVSMGKSTPFAGWQVFGKNVMTFVNGERVWQE